MLIDRIKITLSKTIQEREFEPIRIEVGAEAQLTAEDDVIEASNELRGEVKEELDEAIKRVVKK